MNAIRLQQLAYRLYKKGIPKIPGLITKWIHIRYSSDIHYVTAIGGGTTLGHGGIGVVINAKSVIGRNVILAQNVTIAGKDGGCPVIDDWCYIGANSVVLGGVHLGKNVFVGALTLVNKDMPDNAVVAGIPARVIRIQTDEEVENWHKWVLAHGGINIRE